MSTASQESPSFLALPYSERQKIVVVDDAVAKSVRRSERDEQEKGRATGGRTVGEWALRSLVPGLFYVDLFRALGRLNEEGVPVLNVGRSESSLYNRPPFPQRWNHLRAYNPNTNT